MFSSNGPGRMQSWLESLLGICLTLLVAALALHWAVRLIADVWVGLAVIGGIVLVLAVAVAGWRGRSRGW